MRLFRLAAGCSVALLQLSAQGFAQQTPVPGFGDSVAPKAGTFMPLPTPHAAPSQAAPQGQAPAQPVTTPLPSSGQDAAPSIAPPQTHAAKPARKVHKAVARRPAPIERGIVNDDPRPVFTQETARLTLDAAQRYQEIADRGGWPLLPAGVKLSQGAKGPAVLTLRERLASEGDLDQSQAGNAVFDKSLTEAVKLFQSRHGLAKSGVVAGATLSALNVPADKRANQLRQSARRIADRSFAFGPRYVVVNIPAASVEAVENGLVAKRYVAVVGKPDRPSPQVEARISTVNINPTWTVPTSIIRKDIIPKMQKDPGYLSKAKIRILDSRGNTVEPRAIDWSSERAVNFTLRQDSGASNALGRIRIDMPNHDSVYMHDTPTKKLFSAQDRFHSSGCVRVQDVKGLASWLLEGTNGNWDRDQIEAAIEEGERRDIRLARPTPVIWVYMTGFVSDDGTVNFRDDVYDLDSGAAVIAAARKAIRPAAIARRHAPALPDTPQAEPPSQMIDPIATGSISPKKALFW